MPDAVTDKTYSIYFNLKISMSVLVLVKSQLHSFNMNLEWFSTKTARKCSMTSWFQLNCRLLWNYFTWNQTDTNEFDSFNFKLKIIWEFKLATVRAIWKCTIWSCFLLFDSIESNRIEPNLTTQLIFNGITADIFTFCLYRHSIARNDIVGNNFSVVWQHLAGVYTGKLRSGNFTLHSDTMHIVALLTLLHFSPHSLFANGFAYLQVHFKNTAYSIFYLWILWNE